MLISTNFKPFFGDLGFERMLDVFSEAGFEALDFGLNLPEFIGDLDEEFFLDAKGKIKAHGLVIGQAHAPFPSNFEDEAKTARRFDQIVKSFEYSAHLGVPYLVIHPLKPYGGIEADDPERFFEMNLEFYRRLLPHAKRCGVGIAIENCVGSLTRSSRTLARLIRELDDEVFSVCFDVGHANYAMHKYPELDLTIDGMIRELGDLITCTHIHDNDGTRDGHTMPYYGNIDWDSVCRAFADIGYSGNLNYESSNFSAALPPELDADAARYMVSVAKHLAESIRSHTH